MKKIFSLLLLSVMVVSLVACGGKTDSNNYAGTWVSETWTNEHTGISSDIILYLYDDGTFKKETTNSNNEYKEVHGEWEIENSEIILTVHKVVAGEEPGYGEDGLLMNGFSPVQNLLTIVNSTTLESGYRTYNKTH